MYIYMRARCAAFFCPQSAPGRSQSVSGRSQSRDLRLTPVRRASRKLSGLSPPRHICRCVCMYVCMYGYIHTYTPSSCMGPQCEY